MYEDIYNSLSNWGKHSIKTLIIDEESKLPYSAMFTASQERVMDFVLDKYGENCVLSLSDKTYQQGSPGDLTIKRYGAYKEISNDLMKTYYTEQAKQRGVSNI
ncbi:hypothetical protein [Candidatus Liberibacter sp.]|uniref:hypothetical protein n=1 Tax=Candidatus Liberibacter sp. TaxID=34022 RepID=UPI0015F394DD|nr:hypothetical protein [Candidatus Liberibacter sp.]